MESKGSVHQLLVVRPEGGTVTAGQIENGGLLETLLHIFYISYILRCILYSESRQLQLQ